MSEDNNEQKIKRRRANVSIKDETISTRKRKNKDRVKEAKPKKFKVEKIVTKRKNKTRKKFKLDKRKLTIGIVFLAVVILWFLVANYTIVGIVFNKNITDKDTIQFEIENGNNQVLEYKKEILVYSSGKMSTYDRYGKKTWETDIADTMSAELSTNGEYIQVINKDQGLVHVYKNKYESARIKIEGNILGGNINRAGDSVIEYSSTGAKTILGIYDNRGKNKYNVKLSNNIIGEYILSDNSRFLAYVDMNIEGISASSNINIIDFNKTTSDSSNVKVVYSKENTLAYKINWDGNRIIVRLDDEIVKYNVQTGAINVTDTSIEGVLNIDTDMGMYAYVQATSGNSGYLMSIKSLSSKYEKKIDLTDSPKYFSYVDHNIFIASQKEIQIYNSLGIKIKDYKSDKVITKPIIFNDGKSVAIVTSNRIVMFTI